MKPSNRLFLLWSSRVCLDRSHKDSSDKDTAHVKQGSGVDETLDSAQKKGFARRDSVADIELMESVFRAPEVISDGVKVANLPEKEVEKTEFDTYKRSTTDFTSLVTPHGITGTGMGAGFGAKEDKRLGFLNLNRPLRPFTGIVGITDSPVRYDENGFPVEKNLSQDEARRLRLEYLKSFQGTTLSNREHFLLVDLDFDKDAVLFGNTRAEFEANVTKLKKVILQYNRWERTDNFYYYSTILLKLLTVWVLMECLHQVYELRLLSTYYELFEEMTRCEIDNLESSRRQCYEQARAELSHNTPTFIPVLNAIQEEKRRVAEASLASAKQQELPPDSPLREREFHPMDTTGEEEFNKRKATEEQTRELRRLQQSAANEHRFTWRSIWHFFFPKKYDLLKEDFAQFSYAASPTSIGSVKNVRRILLPRSEDYTQVVREEMLRYRQEKRQSAFS